MNFLSHIILGPSLPGCFVTALSELLGCWMTLVSLVSLLNVCECMYIVSLESGRP